MQNNYSNFYCFENIPIDKSSIEIFFNLIKFLDSKKTNNTLPYPLITFKIDSKTLLIDGVKRFINNSYKYSNCLVINYENLIKKLDIISENINIVQVLAWALVNSEYRQLSEMEKAFLVSTIDNEDTNNTIIYCSKIFDINIDMISLYKKYLTLPIGIQKYIHNFSPAKNIVKLLLSINSELLNDLALLTETFYFNPSSLRQIAQNASDVYCKTNTNIFKDKELILRLNESGTNGFTEYLNNKRFPILSNKIEIIKKSIQDLKPKNYKIDFDQTLENPNLTISLNIKNIESLNIICSELNSIQTIENLKIIFKELNEYKS